MMFEVNGRLHRCARVGRVLAAALALGSASFSSSSCGDEGLDLFVELRTDLAPIAEFAAIEVRITGLGETVALDSRGVTRADDFYRGERISELSGADEGDYLVEVRLLDADGAPTASRRVRLTLRETYALTVVITRSCREVTCGDGQTCIAGTCTDDRCGAELPELCPTPECAADTDCTVAASCADARCVSGACFAEAAADGCSESEWCDPVLDCRPLPGVGLAPFTTPTLIASLAADSREDDPTVTGDLLELYFDSERVGGAGGGDIWLSRRSSATDPWGAPTPVAELNSGGYDTSPEVLPDGLTIYFASNRLGTLGNNDIWFSTRTSRDQPWSPPTHLPELSSAADDTSAATIPANTLVALMSRRAAADFDLYEARRATSSDGWPTPTPLTDLNSGADDADPYYLEDGLSLFFASDRPGGMGGRDIYVATRAAITEPFGAPVALEGINGPNDDTDVWISPDYSYVVFVSDRSGNQELYEARRVP